MADQLKIVIYVHALTGGGAERACALLASGLARRGHDVTLVTDFAASQNLSYVDASVRPFALGNNHLPATLRLAAFLRREKPDVSLSAMRVSNLKHTIAAAIAGRLSRAILSSHGYFESEPQLLSRIGFFAVPILTRLA